MAVSRAGGVVASAGNVAQAKNAKLAGNAVAKYFAMNVTCDM
jgi:hypothetical protein